jgi:SRSO17 transposase
MRARELKALDGRLQNFTEELTVGLGRAERRRWAGYYLRGLLLDGQRKSIEPMACRVGVDVQGLQQFIGQSPWSAEVLLQALHRRASRSLGRATYWIVDETSFPKQGRHSVAVARQYCGSLGKLANCQVAVSLHASNADWSWPMGWQLYIPQPWLEDRALQQKAGMPPELVYQSKPQLALQLIDQALDQGKSVGTVLADHLYGNGFGWRAHLRSRGVPYCVSVSAETGVWLRLERAEKTARGRPALRPPRPEILSLKAWALQQRSDLWTTIQWREGGKGPMRSRFAMVPVWAANRVGANRRTERWQEYALLEWPQGEPAPTRYWLAWQAAEPSLRELVVAAKARWRVEQDYRELKEELGLDHFEGRGWMGWHHHVALVTTAYVFLRLEQQRSKKNLGRDSAADPAAVMAAPAPA